MRRCREWGILGMALLFLFGMGLGCTPESRFSKRPVTSAAAAAKGPTAFSSEFGDILIPSVLEVDNKASYVVRTPGLTTGMLALKGRVKRNSLIDFFNHNMAKDNWRPVTLFKSPQTSTVMLFRKENRWCVISISEEDFNTYVQIGVAPSFATADGDMLK